MSYTGKRASLLFIIYFGVQIIRDLPTCSMQVTYLAATINTDLSLTS